ncbi:MAG TPA: 3-phosphoshikimate 1-carboxyvinyltransferase [Dehalococcoidia bacterium]|nr:3-phosphoshikimate 1-carboxyvinyltransferase [Dehalococcoidia bacterium]
MEKRIASPRRLSGSIAVPPDKSISHRAAILNAIAAGPAAVESFLPAADCLATLACLRLLGVSWTLQERTNAGSDLAITGRGLAGLGESEDVLDARNSGTTMRLLAGLLAGRPFLSVLTGDESLRSRPMARIVEPLREMGAQVWGRNRGTLAPLAITGGRLRGIHHRSPVASAQVKSAILLAGLQAEGDTLFEEPARSRDHTERMLRAMGADVKEEGVALRLSPLAKDLTPLSLRVPGDFSAAAFWLVAAATHADAELTLPDVGVNPTRTGLLDALREMGAQVTVSNQRVTGGEPVADLKVRSGRLKGVVVEGPLVVRLIDEVPVLAVAAAMAEGRTVIRDVGELRLKESDRVKLIIQELKRMGARIDEEGDALVIEGTGRLNGAVCDSHGDHRLAMALAVAGLVAEGETVVEAAEATDVSYPGFWRTLEDVRGAS